MQRKVGFLIPVTLAAELLVVGCGSNEAQARDNQMQKLVGKIALFKLSANGVPIKAEAESGDPLIKGIDVTGPNGTELKASYTTAKANDVKTLSAVSIEAIENGVTFEEYTFTKQNDTWSVDVQIGNKAGQLIPVMTVNGESSALMGDLTGANGPVQVTDKHDIDTQFDQAVTEAIASISPIVSTQ